MKRILLIPFCLSLEAKKAAELTAAEKDYTVIVVRSTAKALAEVRSRVKASSVDKSIRIVGVVCYGRAKKIWVVLMLLKARQALRRLLFRRDRRIELAWVPITGGSLSLFGRRKCNIGRNEPDYEVLRKALQGCDTYMTI